MATKPEELPSLDEDLTPAPARPANPPRLRPRAVIPDDQVQANSRVLGVQWGAATPIRLQEPLTPLEPLSTTAGLYAACVVFVGANGRAGRVADVSVAMLTSAD